MLSSSSLALWGTPGGMASGRRPAFPFPEERRGDEASPSHVGLQLPRQRGGEVVYLDWEPGARRSLGGGIQLPLQSLVCGALGLVVCFPGPPHRLLLGWGWGSERGVGLLDHG